VATHGAFKTQIKCGRNEGRSLRSTIAVIALSKGVSRQFSLWIGQALFPLRQSSIGNGFFTIIPFERLDGEGKCYDKP
jgi:hypothetical protein